MGNIKQKPPDVEYEALARADIEVRRRIVANIKRCMDFYDLKQKNLAHLLGLSGTQALTNFLGESNLKFIKYQRMQDIAGLLGVQVEELYKGDFHAVKPEHLDTYMGDGFASYNPTGSPLTPVENLFLVYRRDGVIPLGKPVSVEYLVLDVYHPRRGDGLYHNQRDPGPPVGVIQDRVGHLGRVEDLRWVAAREILTGTLRRVGYVLLMKDASVSPTQEDTYLVNYADHTRLARVELPMSGPPILRMPVSWEEAEEHTFNDPDYCWSFRLHELPEELNTLGRVVFFCGEP